MLCFGGNNGSVELIINGGTAPYNYTNPSNQVAGTYTETITDTNGCQTDVTFTITEPTLLTVTADVTNVSCFEGSDGSAILNVTGGTAPYNYTCLLYTSPSPRDYPGSRMPSSA